MPLQIEPLHDDDAAAALAVLDAAESRAGMPLVDEAERRRLEATVAGHPRPAGWHPLVVHLDDEVAGYGAVLVDEVAATATGDAAVTEAGVSAATLRVLLDALADTAAADGAHRLVVWVRRAGDPDLDAAAAAGFGVERRLGVLGRDLDDLVDPGPDGAAGRAPDDVLVRAYRPDEDDVQVVAVLAAAYAGTAEAGWDLARFRERRSWPWFRPEDLLVAELPDGSLGGLHWLKRRGGGIGEVHNLAVHPAAQGRGLGPVLLRAGLEHLRSVGCHEVLLWVDLANERAVALYTAQGFTTRWQDVALARPLRAPDAPRDATPRDAPPPA